LLNPTTQEGFFPVSVFKLEINTSSCSEVEGETGEEDGKQESSPAKIDKTFAALKAMPVHLN